MELVLRFLIGGLVVSCFAMLGDVFKPKSFAGLFAAAPTVALATTYMTLRAHGAGYVAVDARSMMAGAVAQMVYSSVCAVVLMRGKMRALPLSVLMMPVWFVVAGTLWAVWLRR